jgi:hypothetical protein
MRAPLALQYTTPFYLTYLSRWPDMCTVLEAPGGTIASYSACPAR